MLLKTQSLLIDFVFDLVFKYYWIAVVFKWKYLHSNLLQKWNVIVQKIINLFSFINHRNLKQQRLQILLNVEWKSIGKLFEE